MRQHKPKSQHDPLGSTQYWEDDNVSMIAKSFEVEVGFSVDEWVNIKKACEDIKGKKLDKDEIIDMVVIHCKESMKTFVRQMNTPPGLFS